MTTLAPDSFKAMSTTYKSWAIKAYQQASSRPHEKFVAMARKRIGKHEEHLINAEGRTLEEAAENVKRRIDSLCCD